MQWHYIKKYMSQGVYNLHGKFHILVSQSAQFSHHAALLIILFNAPSKQSLMSDFECCAGSLPFCLGMVDFDCNSCGVKHKFDNQENTDDDFQSPTNPFSSKMPTFHQSLTVMVKAQLISLSIFVHLEVGNRKETIDDLLDGIDIKDIFD